VGFAASPIQPLHWAEGVDFRVESRIHRVTICHIATFVFIHIIGSSFILTSFCVAATGPHLRQINLPIFNNLIFASRTAFLHKLC